MDRASVIDALAEVYDPELDEPITRLGFVSSCEVSPDGDVEVVLRLPTPQCAPNFAFLMAADARKVVRRLPEVRDVTITLEDHYTGDEINAAIGRGDGFAGAFPGETADEDLASLRELFVRKALVGRESRLCEMLLRDGATAEEVAASRIKDMPDVPDARRCVELRRLLGLAHDPESPAFVLPSGEPVPAVELRRWLRTARLVRMSLEVNGGMCRSLMQIRHGVAIEDPEEVLR
ncbi:MAG TPA: iron-sulfur cluster assembly protein [Solirubrobacteraceae bacterium]|jgi:metal-sulfur cluster biosynthetic enzyme